MSKEMWFIFGCILFAMQTGAGQSRESYDGLRLNAAGYFEGPGLNVMAFDDFYPEGHQGGVTIIQCGERVAANGDVRLEPTPGQWSPMPMLLGKRVDREAGTISVTLAYPDTSRDRRGFNPILYPDLSFRYTITTTASDSGVRIVVDLEQPLPRQWADRVGFNLELFPAQYFGEHYLMDGHPGQFPRQVNGPMQLDTSGQVLTLPLAEGRQLIAVPGDETKELRIRSQKSNLQLIDGRALYNNGWFVLRSTIPAGAVRGAVEWTITPRIKPGWRRAPVVQVSQIGYHPRQIKRAVIELDKSTQAFSAIELVRIDGDSERVVLAERSPTPWGTFLRYAYVRFDFSTITQEGLYKVRYGGSESRIFEISRDVYARHVWQPTLEYFLPVQMCHMRVNDRYRVWHGLCHMDDALMAPLNHVHFDGYQQGPSTLTKFRSGEHIPGVNIGGWHDAGDYDIRVESQAETVYKLSLAYELFKNNYDATSIDQTTRIVELHVPDGKPDILQQVEHGVLSIVGAYESMGRLYRGMICPTLRQYVHLGDAATMSDNLIYGPGKTDPVLHQALPMDDRWLFTEENPERELHAAQCLSAASRVLAKYSPQLSARCLRTAKALYAKNRSLPPGERLNAAAELYLTTGETEYATVLLKNSGVISKNIEKYSAVLGRVSQKLADDSFTATVTKSVKEYEASVLAQQRENPYGVPYKPYVWGAGWDIQDFGVGQLFLSLGFPDVVTTEYAFNALNFVLGCHPGSNRASFASGVGTESLTVAYGANRDDWSYIPGGIASGTALIRPDFPELKTWPYLWQQAEYVMGGGAADYMLLAMAADALLNR